MIERKPAIDGYLLGAAFILAVLARLVNLGLPALNDAEAAWGLQALRSMQGVQAGLGSQPAYVQLTSVLFTFLGSSNFVARFWPAVMGSLIVLVPILLRSRLGRLPVLLLAFMLAIEPGLLAISRQAGSPVFALVGGWLALTFWLAGKPGWAGFFLGVALLGGESFWPGLVGFAIASWLMRSIDRTAFLGLVMRRGEPAGHPAVMVREALNSGSTGFVAHPVRRLLYFTLGTLLVVGTLFLTHPIGISGLAGDLTTYLSGWANPSGVSILQMVMGLAVYAPAAVIFGLWGGLRSWFLKDPIDQFLSLWAVIALLLALVNPARQVESLVWALLPLWILAVREFLRHVSLPKEEWINSISQALLTFCVLVFIWLTLQALVNDMTTGTSLSLHLGAIGIAVALLIFASFLISWGWGGGIVVRGLVWGLGAVLLVYMTSAATEAGAMRTQYTSELWTHGASHPQESLLINTINELSDTHAGFINNLDVVVVGTQSPGLEWALHPFPKSSFTSTLESGVKPSIVITPKETEPTLAASYRGEAFILSQQPDWNAVFSSQFLQWLIYHTAPQAEQSVILWARTDLFPGGTLTPSTNPNP